MTPEESRKEELRPCPFCKTALGLSEGESSLAWYRCVYCRISFPIEHWRNAYCWKEIDSLREQVSNLSKDKWLRSEEIAEGAKKLAEKEWQVERNELREGVKELRNCLVECVATFLFLNAETSEHVLAENVDPMTMDQVSALANTEVESIGKVLEETATLLGGEER